MRANRLVAALLLMQAKGRVTAAEVAAELDVSVATARRDLEALSAAGVPVYPQPGRGGGWSLVGGARTDLSGLTATEAQALFRLAGPAAAAAAPEARSALRKLLRALPGPFRADAEAAAAAIVVDPAGWGARDRTQPALVEALQAAVVRRRVVELTYTRPGQAATRRRVDPWGLVDKDGTWYLIGGTEGGERTFRVDRITDAVVTGDEAQRPADFDLAAAWNRVVGAVEPRRSVVSATVLIERRYLPVLHDHFGRHCRVVGEADDGRTQVRVAAHTAVSVAEQLAGWGARVEVLKPAAVRAELARLGAELTATYGPTQAATARGSA